MRGGLDSRLTKKKPQRGSGSPEGGQRTRAGRPQRVSRPVSVNRRVSKFRMGSKITLVDCKKLFFKKKKSRKVSIALVKISTDSWNFCFNCVCVCMRTQWDMT